MVLKGRPIGGLIAAVISLALINQIVRSTAQLQRPLSTNRKRRRR